MKDMTTVGMDRDADQVRAGLFRAMENAEKRRNRELRRGKAKQLGPMESLALRLRGRADGKSGMPKETAAGVWMSPLVQKELDAQQEHRERLWGAVQLELIPYQLRTESLLTVIAARERRLDELREKLQPEGDEICASRKRGEERLSEAQIGARRQRELDRRNSKVLSECREIEDSLTPLYEELSILHCYISESEDTAKLCCERIMDHTRQRIDAYWHAAMQTHPQGLEMPAAPDVPRETTAEAAYMERHAQTRQAVTLALEAYRKKQETNRTYEAGEEAAA